MHGAYAGRGGKDVALLQANGNEILARLLQDDPRPVYEVVADALRNADALMVAARQAIVGGQFTLEDVDRLTEATRFASSISIAVSRLGIAERAQLLHERYGNAVEAALRAILADLSLTVRQQSLVGEVVPKHLRRLGQQIDAIDGEVVASRAVQNGS